MAGVHKRRGQYEPGVSSIAGTRRALIVAAYSGDESWLMARIALSARGNPM